MLFNIKRMRTWWPLATLITTLTLAGCSDDDRKGIITPDSLNQVGSGEMFHGAEWATIKNLDPRGEQCVDCHGKSADMSPNGKLAHNIGLQKNTDHSAYADLKITGVKVDETSGEVTVTLNQALPANAGNLSMTFAKLAPRVIHNRGHDWQNYFNSNATGRGGNEPTSEWFENGGVAPQTVPSPKVSGNQITFSLGDGAGRSFGKNTFKVKSAYESDAAEWAYTDVLGTKFSAADWDISEHVYCNEAYAGNSSGNNDAASPANQLADDNNKRPVCWWPDGTHLTSGVFATKNNEFIVAYEPDYTHRVTLILGSSPGNPGFNTWFDFVPSVANGTKTPTQISVTDTANSVTYDAADYIKPNTGEVIPANYQFNTAGRGLPDSNATGNYNLNSETAFHQKLPAARDVVDVQSCNSCHDGLTMHGGSGRSQTQTCVTCHNPGNLQASSGRSVDFKVLIHRIHRGTNLPSEDADIKSHMNGDKTLLSAAATDFTKVRFPQGSRPGNPEGITNCVKCHMGSETNNLVQKLADDVGAAGYDVKSELKLAKITPQGDNWLAVRNVNACQACHDSNVWIANGSINGDNKYRTGNSADKDPADHGTYQLDKYMPFYGDKYLDIGYKWLGKKLTGTATGGGGPKDAGWIHNTGAADDGSRFTCGSGGGCHGNNNITGLDSKRLGDAEQIAIERVHLRLTKNFIIAERFEIQISDPEITAEGKFSAVAQIFDKKTNTPLSINADRKATPDTALGELTFNVNGNLGWMHNSPDFNHSPGGGIPGSPLGLNITWDGSTDGSVTADLSTMARTTEWNKIKDDFANVIGSFYIEARAGDYNLQTAVKDFRFDGKPLGIDEGRRKVVDFTAGNGIDEDRDRYAGWDKHDGANTQSCSSCHLELSYHGGARRTNNVQACVICHNSQRTDVNNGSRRGLLSTEDDNQYEESLDFKRLIHAVHAAGDGFRIDMAKQGGSLRPSPDDASVQGHSFPGALSNCQSCHIKDENTGKWTFDLTQIPEGMIGSSAITADWSKITDYATEGDARHDFNNHLKMTPIASVCSSCHDAGYKTKPTEGRQNANILDGGPYVGSHWWVMGGIAPGIVRPNELPSKTKHQSGL